MIQDGMTVPDTAEAVKFHEEAQWDTLSDILVPLVT